ncbi:hypothetical protein Hypma_012517 [Hypsizygus marmoreus]|uniref:Uncharacterized protein n=1 Tax=Hypsizygus marmoreus TaxID=39966 RepID=A0A369JE23_HYPMA|nr:hypothetical protein Hypma_012517 [Hypsizygus marmoreus]
MPPPRSHLRALARIYSLPGAPNQNLAHGDIETFKFHSSGWFVRYRKYYVVNYPLYAEAQAAGRILNTRLRRAYIPQLHHRTDALLLLAAHG